LKDALPVILAYWTAEADAKGYVAFREDVYDQDPAVLKALDGPTHMRIIFRERDLRRENKMREASSALRRYAVRKGDPREAPLPQSAPEESLAHY
jgi:hypothetical protein